MSTKDDTTTLSGEELRLTAYGNYRGGKLTRVMEATERGLKLRVQDSGRDWSTLWIGWDGYPTRRRPSGGWRCENHARLQELRSRFEQLEITKGNNNVAEETPAPKAPLNLGASLVFTGTIQVADPAKARHLGREIAGFIGDLCRDWNEMNQEVTGEVSISLSTKDTRLHTFRSSQQSRRGRRR